MASAAVQRFGLLRKGDKRPPRPGRGEGGNADADWVERLGEAIGPPSKKGTNEPLMASTGLKSHEVSRARKGMGSAATIYAVSRAAGISPPRDPKKRLLDEPQWRALDTLERFRGALRERLGEDSDAAVDAMTDQLLRAFDAQARRILGEPEGGVPERPLGRTGTHDE